MNKIITDKISCSIFLKFVKFYTPIGFEFVQIGNNAFFWIECKVSVRRE